MEEKRLFPRIKSDWQLFLDADENAEPIGYVRNISLSGASLFFLKDYVLEPGKHRFTIELMNKQLKPPKLLVSGLKEWEKKEKNEIFLGITLDKMEKEKRTSLMRFLSRSDKLQVQAFLLEEAPGQNKSCSESDNFDC